LPEFVLVAYDYINKLPTIREKLAMPIVLAARVEHASVLLALLIMLAAAKIVA
jgi:hypothetical protein